MKKAMSYFFIISCLSVSVRSQSSEFPIYSNGLIYDTATISNLKVIVDSLNLQFRSCDLDGPFYSLAQGFAYVVDVPKLLVSKIRRNEISWEEFRKTYAKRIKYDSIWVVKSGYDSYEGKKMIGFYPLPDGGSQYPVLQTSYSRKIEELTSGWILGEEKETAIFLTGLQKRKIPETYARYVQYVDCMIDTTAQVFLTDGKGMVYQRVQENSKAEDFVNWAGKFPNKPKYPDWEEDDFDDLYYTYQVEYELWDRDRLNALDAKMEKSHYWKSLLIDAKEEAVTHGNSDSRLEYYVARYLSKDDALLMKRKRRVVGNCSMDMSPRYHAMEISTLAAETAKWDIFLRAHLDVMNDRFDRMSDGSYAWEGRRTYLRELEELEINAIDLLLGISLRVDNVSDNHYTGSIARVGRALSDAQDSEHLELQLLELVGDARLDPYNRILAAFLYYNFYHYLPEESHEWKSKNLQAIIDGWPEHMKEVWKEVQ